MTATCPNCQTESRDVSPSDDALFYCHNGNCRTLSFAAA